jgi:hypothetical protein
MFLAGYFWPDELLHDVLGRTERTAVEASVNSIWAWSTADIVRNPQSVIRWGRSAGVRSVYLAVNRKTAETIETDSGLAACIRLLRRNNITTSALFGDPLWIFDDHRLNLEERIQKIILYNQSVPDSMRFRAIHLDIEPHTLPDWQNKQSDYLQRLVDAVQRCREIINEHNIDLMLEIDIPIHYQKYDSLAFAELLATVDKVSIMAYARKQTERILADIDGIREAAVNAGTSYEVALKANDFDSLAGLALLADDVRQALECEEMFAGIAVHSFDEFLYLLEQE